MPNKKICSSKTEYQTNNNLAGPTKKYVLPCPTKIYVVRKQTLKQKIITRSAQQKKCRLKTDYETNNHLPCPTKKYVVQKQSMKQKITCSAQHKNM